MKGNVLSFVAEPWFPLLILGIIMAMLVASVIFGIDIGKFFGSFGSLVPK